MTKLIKGTVGKDVLTGGNASELILGLEGNDKLFGNGGADILKGGDGNDMLDGGKGKDQMLGGSGNDVYYVDVAGDTVKEGQNGGQDTVNSSISYSLTSNLEKLILSGTSDLDATGNKLDNVLAGNSGDNLLDGKSGADRMIGQGGDDRYIFNDVGDKAIEALGGGTDTVISSISLVLSRDLENLTLTGASDLSGTGNELKNVITGNDGSNSLDGGIGIDWMLGGGGADIYVVDNSADKITEVLNKGIDSVTSTASYTLSANVENLTLAGLAANSGKGNDLANIITGNGAANKLYADNIVGDGLGGGDELHGAAGNDTLYAGDGTNTLDGGDGTIDVADYSLFSTTITVTIDSFTSEVSKFDGAIDTLTDVENVRGGAVADTFNVSATGSFYAGAGNDTMLDGLTDAIAGKFYGESGDDTLTVGADGGTLDGGTDDDILVASQPSAQQISFTGGTGTDQFWLAVNTNGSGGALADGTLSAAVHITDFEDGVDHLVFAPFGSVDTADEWYALLTTANEITHESDGLHVGTDGGVEVVIKGLSLSTFSADDILVLA